MTPDDRTCIELKEFYLEALHQILATKKPKENMRGIRRILDYTRTHPIGVHRPDEHRTWVWSDLHLRHSNIIRYCKRPFVDAGQMGKAWWRAGNRSSPTMTPC